MEKVVAYGREGCLVFPWPRVRKQVPFFWTTQLSHLFNPGSKQPVQLDGTRGKPRRSILLSTVVQVLRSGRSQDSEGSGNPARQPLQLSEHTRDFSPWYMLPAVPGS